MPLMKESAKLLNFFIYNSNFGQEEGFEHRKILYYYPRKDSSQTQVRNVGLAEAITRFSSTFNTNDDCESLHTQKTVQIYYQPEPSIWMVMTVAVSWVEREKESGIVKEYHGETLQDEVLKSELVRSYRSFKLKNFTITSLLEAEENDEKENPVKLKETLNTFYEDYLSSRDLVCGSVVKLWGDISFLPLDKLPFLKVHCCLSSLESSFPTIVHSSFLYRGSFIWCGFQMDDLPALSQFLLTRINGKYFTSSVQSSVSNASINSSQNSNNSDTKRESINYSCRFIGDGPNPSERVYLRDENGDVKLHQVVLFAVEDACVCLSFSDSEVLDAELFNRLAKALESSIPPVVTEISEQLSKRRKPESFKYLYHNYMNVATKSSLIGANELSEDTMKSVVDVHSDMIRFSSSEMIVKTASDHWVVGRKGNGRESFIVINDKSANLTEVTAEVNKMSESLFKNMFLIK